MRNIYDFEAEKPPALNENMLRDTLEKKRSKRLALLLVFANLPIYASCLMIASRLYESEPTVSLFCMAFVIVLAVGSALTAAIFSIKEEKKYELDCRA